MLVSMNRKEKAFFGLAAIALWILGTVLERGRIFDDRQIESLFGLLALCLIGYALWRMRYSKENLKR